MSATVQSPIGGSGGSDLSELTSGEKAFIGLLVLPISIDFIHKHMAVIGGTMSRFEYYEGIGLAYNMSLDLSKITSVNVVSNEFDGLTVYWTDANGNNIGGISSTGSVQVPSGARGLIITTVQSMNIYFQITSFTTTDGRVHTASDLNY